jgi:hypothetical protein
MNRINKPEKVIVGKVLAKIAPTHGFEHWEFCIGFYLSVIDHEDPSFATVFILIAPSLIYLRY